MRKIRHPLAGPDDEFMRIRSKPKKKAYLIFNQLRVEEFKEKVRVLKCRYDIILFTL